MKNLQNYNESKRNDVFSQSHNKQGNPYIQYSPLQHLQKFKVYQ